MQMPREEEYTYADYASWEDSERYELLDGIPYMMAPAPSVEHQEISTSLVGQFYAYLKDKTCKVFSAPFDVRLNADTRDDTVVQPDITVVCDPKKIENGKNCQGAPDMVIEILSPSTARHDQLVKYNKYREAGVREYWIVNPMERFAQVHLLRDGEYITRSYGDAEMVPVAVLENCQINLAEVFPPAPPEEEKPRGPQMP